MIQFKRQRIAELIEQLSVLIDKGTQKCVGQPLAQPADWNHCSGWPTYLAEYLALPGSSGQRLENHRQDQP